MCRTPKHTVHPHSGNFALSFTDSIKLHQILRGGKKHANKSQDGNLVNLSKVSCVQKSWLPLVPGKSKINLFSISFFCTHASVLPPGQWLHTALNTELRICIEASDVVLASCVIELCIYIQAHDATAWSSVLGGQFAARRTWLGIRRTGEVMPGADKGTEYSLAQKLKTVRRKGLCL